MSASTVSEVTRQHLPVRSTFVEAIDQQLVALVEAFSGADDPYEIVVIRQKIDALKALREQENA